MHFSKIILILWMSMTLTQGQFPGNQYGNPDFFSRSSNIFGSSGGGYNENNFGREQSSGFDDDIDEESSSEGSDNSGGGKIHKFISVHIAPREEAIAKSQKPKRIPQKPETHYQIVFIKAPSPSGQDAQEIELPPLPQTKTLVYVLLKKSSLSDMVRLKSQPTPKPSPPEVFFIRYKGQKGEQSGHGGNPPSKDEFESPENEIGPSAQYGSPFSNRK